MMNQRKGSIAVLDVLICVCIIVVLAAVLFPSYTRCRTPARPRSCQSNLKECAVALQLYWNDYDGYLPSSVLVNHSKKWNRRDFMTFATKRGVLPSVLAHHQRTWPEILYDHMKNKDVMWCPSDPALTNDPKAQVTFWYKLAIDKAWYGDGCVKPCRKESDFAYNADQIVFYEHKYLHFSGNHGQSLVNGAQINVAYMDSHVKTITLENTTSGNPNNCAANLDGEPMYFNYDYKTSKKLPDGIPAKYIDPGRYGDSL